MSGSVVSFNDIGVIFRGEDDKYTDRISWTKFSQEGLKQLSANPKIKPLVEPFIEIPASELPKKPEVKVGPVTRLELPPKQSLFGALFSSSVGLVVLLLVYAANLYAAYEVAICRARPIAVVMGLALVLPFIGSAIFLAMPVKVEAAPVVEDVPAADPQSYAVPGVPQPAAETATVAVQAAGPTRAQTQVFKRGKFTFNRRFIETKFASFLGAGGAETLLVNTAHGQLAANRITRIGQSEFYLETPQGEVMVPFSDIQEIQVKSPA